MKIIKGKNILRNIVTIGIAVTLFSTTVVSGYAEEINTNVSEESNTKVQNTQEKQVENKDEENAEKVKENPQREELDFTANSQLKLESDKIEQYHRMHPELGRAISPVKSNLKDNGSVQSFSNGRTTFAVYYSPRTNTVTHININGGIANFWINSGWENSRLGYPVTPEEKISNNHWIQRFENGTISYRNGAFVTYNGNPIANYYLRNYVGIGHPVSNEKCGLKDGGCVQTFSDGVLTNAVYYSPVTKVATHVNLDSSLAKIWINSGWENSRLGYPIASEEKVDRNHSVQRFENGTLSVKGNGSAIAYNNRPITNYYLNHSELIGHPVSNEKCGLKDGGCVQTFAKYNNLYAVYSSKNGIYHLDLNHPITKYWINKGWENSSLGYPISDIVRTEIGFKQSFEKGTLLYEFGKVSERLSFEGVLKNYVRENAAHIGRAVNNVRCGLKDNGCVQTFSKNNQSIAVYVSSVTPPAYINLETPIAKEFIKSGWENGKYGYPVNIERTIISNKKMQEFEHLIAFYNGNDVIESPKSNPITKHYLRNSSRLIYPTNNIKCGLSNNGCVQTFMSNQNEKVAVYSYAGKIGEIKLDKPYTKVWAKQGWEESPLGYPTYESNNKQYFENGYIQDENTYITDKQAAFTRYYNANKGIYGSKIVSNLRCGLKNGGCVATLEKNNGTQTAIYITPKNGIVPIQIDGPVTKLWIKAGWENSKQGYPISTVYCDPVRCEQQFENGRIIAEKKAYPNNSSRMSGIDIASWQRTLKIKNVPEAQFIIVKATGGTGYVNPFHKTHADQVIQLGKKIGFYHFAHEIGYQGSPEAEARHFVNTVRPYLRYGPMLVLDNESDNRTDVAWNKKWLDEVYRLTGVKPVIYMSQSVVNEANWSSVAQSDYPLWVAYYPRNASTGVAIGSTPYFPIKWWEKAIMWQYTSNLRLPGYGSDLDGNVFYGDAGIWAYYALPR